MDINVTQKAKPLFSYYHYDNTNAEKEFAKDHPQYSWHVNKVVWKRRKWLIFQNDASPLTVIVQNVNAERKKDIKSIFDKTLIMLASYWELPEEKVEEYLAEAGDWKINATLGRKQVGDLNKKVMEAEHMLPFDDDEAIMVSADLSNDIMHVRDKNFLSLNDAKAVLINEK